MAHPVAVDLIDLRHLTDPQSGIISRRQIVEAGGARADLRRWLRARELVEVHKGVYVNHTGPLTWSSRAWAGVQRYWPAALGMESAVNLSGDVIHVVIEHSRTARVPEPRLRVHRLRDFDARVRLDRSPPAQRFEDAVLSVCSTAGRERSLELISEACRSRRTSPPRLHDELLKRGHVGDRAWLLEVLDDAAKGVHSVLESTYLHRVERAHGLPAGDRQRRVVAETDGSVVYRDVLYERYATVVELDGRLGHEAWADRAADRTRDLVAAATSALLTLRLGWQQCEFESCATALGVGSVLQQRGWAGAPVPCSVSCPVTIAA